MSPSGVVVREIVLLGKFVLEPTARVCARIGRMRSPARVRPSIARRRDFARTKRVRPIAERRDRARRKCAMSRPCGRTLSRDDVCITVALVELGLNLVTATTNPPLIRAET